MQRTDDIHDIAAALAKAQAEMENPAFDSQNPHFKNKFASLAAVRNAVVPVLSSHGISMIQELASFQGEQIGCTTHLIHESGQMMSFGPFWMTPTKADPQGFGSAATYCKRYALMAVCGIVGDEDDDAEGATVRMSPQKRTKIIKSLRSEDPFEVLESWEELTQDEQRYIWSELRSDERATIKSLLKTARDAQNAPDPRFNEPAALEDERDEKEQHRANQRKQANA